MLDAGVFPNQSALASQLGCHRGTVSRAVRTATALFGERWIERLVQPVMHQFTGRSADRLADACVDKAQRKAAMRRANALRPGVPAASLYSLLIGGEGDETGRETLFMRRKGRAGGGVVAAKIQRDGGGGFYVNVRPHEQTPAELAELAEQIEALLALETADASGVRLGRPPVRAAWSGTTGAARRPRRCCVDSARAGRRRLSTWLASPTPEPTTPEQDLAPGIRDAIRGPLPAGGHRRPDAIAY